MWSISSNKYQDYKSHGELKSTWGSDKECGLHNTQLHGLFNVDSENTSLSFYHSGSRTTQVKKKNVLRDANSWFDKPLIALWQEFHKIIYVEHLEIAQHIVGTPSYFPTPTPLW